MSAGEKISGHQFGEMHRQLQEGGFTYNPRSRQMVSEGFSVATHPEATYEEPAGVMAESHLAAYTRGAAATWSAPGAVEHIGGWRRPYAPENDVLDLPSVYPPTGEGESGARKASIEHHQEAYSALHRGFTDEPNPFHSDTESGRKYPEFSRLSPEKQLEQPEVQAWVRSPSGRSS